jgi:hypothetical protein
MAEQARNLQRARGTARRSGPCEDSRSQTITVPRTLDAEIPAGRCESVRIRPAHGMANEISKC